MAELKPIIRNEEIINKDGFYITYTVPYTISQNIEDYKHVFCALYNCELIKVSEYHEDPASGSATVQLYLVSGTTETAILNTPFDFQSTDNTPVIKDKDDMIRDTRLKTGDRLKMTVTAGSLSGLRNSQFTFYFVYTGRGNYRYA